MPLEPWTQRLDVSWRRSVKFFERRYEVLRAVEELNLLHQFQVGEDQVSLRLGDAHHLVSFSSSWIEAALLRPGADRTRVDTAVRLIFDRIAPERLVRPRFSFQWLLPVGREYDDARSEAAKALMGSAAAHFTDFALLSDGELEIENVTFRLEAGVVEAAETPYRLARQAGQMGLLAPEHIRVPPELWPVDTLPKVAFFCDSTWEPHQAPEPSPEAVFRQWEECCSAARQLVSELIKQAGFTKG